MEDRGGEFGDEMVLDGRLLRFGAGCTCCTPSRLTLAAEHVADVQASDASATARQILMPPFANAPMEEIVGAAVLGAWSAMAASGRWKSQPSWIDRTGRVLGMFWIGLFLIYLYAYTGLPGTMEPLSWEDFTGRSR